MQISTANGPYILENPTFTHAFFSFKSFKNRVRSQDEKRNQKRSKTEL